MRHGERSRFYRLPWKLPASQEVEEELAFHLEMRARDFEQAGLPPEEARRRAASRLGDRRALTRALIDIAQGRDRVMRRHDWLADFRQDIVVGWRQLTKAPGASALAILTLALGIGASALIFSTLYAVVLRPLPFADPEKLVVVATGSPESLGDVSVGNYLFLEERNRVFSGLAATEAASFNLTGGDLPERLLGLKVTHNFFTVLGLEPELGRGFLAEEDQPGRHLVTVLSHGLWQRRFGGDPNILGRRIELGGEVHEVVGVMPSRLGFELDGAELWVPIAFTPERRRMHDEHFLSVYGRLAIGVSLAQANDDLSRVMTELLQAHPAFYQDRGAQALPLLEVVVGNLRDRLWLLQGAVSLLLLIACGNVAALVLARGLARSGELALRTALGGGRGRLVRQLLAESLVLALLGGALGLILAAAGLELIKNVAPAGIPRLGEARLEGAALAFGVGAAFLSCLLFGLAPALELSRLEWAEGLRSASRGGVGGAARGRQLRRALVAAEVALAVALLTGSGLLVRTALHLARVDPGFNTAGLLTGRIALPQAAYPGHAEAFGAISAMVEQLQAFPGVERAAAASQPPLVGGGSNGLLREGQPFEPQNLVDARSEFVTPDYFATLGMAMVAGRAFTADDRRDQPRVMIVNETLARTLFPGENPLGQRVVCCEGSPEDPRAKEVVGVVADTRFAGPAEEARPEFYLPFDQVPEVAWGWIQRSVVLVTRARSGPAEALTPALRSAVREVDATLPIYDLATMQARYRRSFATARFNTALFAAFGLAGLLLAAMGLYGVTAYLVSERRREIGLRLALGASRGGVQRFVLREGLGPVAVGLVLGTLATLLAGRAIETLLHGVRAVDPFTLASVVMLFLLVALAATLGPARRATLIDPATTLKDG